jgi:hypothetical protein
LEIFDDFLRDHIGWRKIEAVCEDFEYQMFGYDPAFPSTDLPPTR